MSIPSLLARLCAIAVLSAPTQAAAGGVQDYAGRWALKVGARNVFILELEVSDGKLGGRMLRPTHFAFLPTGDSVTQISGVVVGDPVLRARDENGVLHLVVQDSTTQQPPDEYNLTLTDATHAELVAVGQALPPIPLMQVKPEDIVALDWDPKRSYRVSDYTPSNARMTAIFDADQADRTGQDFAAIVAADRGRRAETRSMLEAGLLHTGTDFLHAAFVFQHGDTPDEFLVAHTLALVALRKGRTEAAWLTAATLDRYLHSLNRPQIFGTQYYGASPMADPRQATQEPFERDLIPQALRVELSVPPPGAPGAAQAISGAVTPKKAAPHITPP